MIRVLISLVIFFYTIRVVSYGIYTFRDKNKAGGISLMILGAAVFFIFILSLIDIFK